MSTRVSGANLVQAVKDLSVRWQQTKGSWRDVKSQQFEQTFLDELTPQVARATAAMEELDALLRKVRIDCE